MNSLVILIVAAVIVQYLVERVKDFLPKSFSDKLFTYIKPSVLSLVFSLLISFGCNLGLFALLGYSINPIWIDYILTSIALSGGAVGVNELIKSLQSVKLSNEKLIQNQSMYDEDESICFDEESIYCDCEEEDKSAE